MEDTTRNQPGRVLVTGAGGFLGRRVVSHLLDRGYAVRALVRTPARVEHLRFPGGDICVGDVAVQETLRDAFAGVDHVVHAAADTSGSEEGGRRVTIQGTRNVLELCASHQVRKLIYISSCSVYGVPDLRAGDLVDENAPLERFPERRGAYSWAKLEAERLVTEFMTQGRVRAVCLRPGTIYGTGGEIFTPMLGFSFGNKVFAVIGDGRFVLPLVFVDNLCSAILAAMAHEKSTGKIYNVVDPERVTKRQYVTEVIQKLYPGSRVVYVPYTMLSSLVAAQEAACRALGRRPILTRYRLESSQKPIVYDASRITKDLGWRATVPAREAFARLLASQNRKG